MSLNDINVQTLNGLVPFLPSISWEYTSAKLNAKGIEMPCFSWIQAFFDETTNPPPVFLLVSSLKGHASGDIIVNPVYFSFSGERVFFKGNILYTSGNDRFGNVLTATPFSAFSKVICYGGNQ